MGLFQNTRFSAIRTHFTYENGNLVMEGGTTGKQVLKMIHPLLFEDSEGNKVAFKRIQQEKSHIFTTPLLKALTL